MTIDPTTAASSGTQGAGTAPKADPLGRDAFLQLLVTQLQHQNPTAPQADGEFIAQLAQFSALERLTNIQKSVDSINKFLTSLQSGMLAAATTTTEGKV